MRRPGCLVVLAAIAATATAAQGAALVSLGRTKLPVYYGAGTTRGYLEVEIAQKDYGRLPPTAQYDGFRANIAIERRKESVTAEEVVIRYVEQVLKEDYAAAARLYAPDVDGAAAAASARALRDEIGGLSEIAFRSEWFYKGAKFLLVEFELEGGTSRIMGFGFRNTPRGFLLSSGGSDEEDIVLDLFAYLSETAARGRAKGQASRPFGLSISLGQGLFGMALNFDGPLYDGQQDWRRPKAAAAPGDPRAFAETVLAEADSSDDKAFVRLWCPTDAAMLADAAERDPGGYARTKRGHAATGRVKHILTMPFGADFAHYFIDESDPARLRSMFIAKQGDGFCLSHGPFDRRVRRLLQSEALKDGIWGLWLARRKS